MDYQKQATDFLAASGLEFRAVLIGDDCPTFCEDKIAEWDMDKINVFPRKTHIHGKHYRCTISGKNRGHVSFDFWNSYADEEYNTLGSKEYRNGETVFKHRVKIRDEQNRIKNVNRMRIPTSYDLLACIEKSDPGTLEDFCSEFGYDIDSKRAEQIYLSVCKEYQKIRKFFTDAELEALREIQ